MEVIYTEKILKFLHGLDIRTLNKSRRIIDCLIKYGQDMEMPKSKPLGGGLFELRTTGNTQVRIIYCFHNDKAYLLHAIIKKRMSIPYADIFYARKARKELVGR